MSLSISSPSSFAPASFAPDRSGSPANPTSANPTAANPTGAASGTAALAQAGAAGGQPTAANAVNRMRRLRHTVDEAALQRHGNSSAMRLIGWPCARRVRMSER